MPRKMSGIAIRVIDRSSVARRTPRVVFDRATHLYSTRPTPSRIQATCTVFLAVISEPMPTKTDTSRLASELRVVLGQLIRRLRAEHRFPISQGSVLGRLDRQGAQSVSDLAAVERVRPQSMAQTV